MTASSRPPAASRSAHEAIAGYEYQFDKTVLKLLQAADDHVVEIEGIEDVDLHTPHASEAVQIKYLSGQKYTSPKALRKPVQLMLNHYRTGARWSYVLYVHFGNFGSMPDRFDVAQLKTCLTESPRDKAPIEHHAGMTDPELDDFCSRLRLERGQAFDDQESLLVDSLSTAMKCDMDEVAAIYLAKARDFVHDRAKTGDLSLRTVTRHDLLKSLAVKEFLFSKWQMQKMGADRYLSAQKRRLRSEGFHDVLKERAVYVDVSASNIDHLEELCGVLSRKYLGRLSSAKPWTIVAHGAPDDVRRLKIRLVNVDIAFNDGHEDLEFQSRTFAARPIVNTRGTGSRVLRASYTLRIVKRESLESLDTLPRKFSCLVSIGHEPDGLEKMANRVITLRGFDFPTCMQLMEDIA